MTAHATNAAAPIEAYPLTWPFGRPRTPYHRRRSAEFKVGFSRALEDLLRELRLLGATGIVISTNIPTRRDGLPYADFRQPDDPGVAVYFNRRVVIEGASRETRTMPFVIACDAYNRVHFNVRAIGATVEALRAIQRHGATEMLEQAFTGFAALPPKRGDDERPWHEVLGVSADATADAIRDAYRELARVHHPDAGGDGAHMSRINRAYEAAQQQSQRRTSS